MVSRFGFRWLLPLVLTSVHVGLLLVSPSPSGRTSVHADGRYRAVALQEGGVVEFHPVEPRPLSLPEKVAVIVNLPALLIGIPVAAYVFHGTDLALVYAATPFVPLLWYWVGRWIDVRLGVLPVRPTRIPGAKIRRALTVIAGAMFLLVGLMGLIALFRTKSADTFLMGTGFLLWGVLFLVLRPQPKVSEHQP